MSLESIIGVDLEDYLQDLIRYNILPENDNTEFTIKIEEDGFLLIPTFPTTFPISQDTYNKIFAICSLALQPSITLIQPITMQIRKSKDINFHRARGLWFPYRTSFERFTGTIEDLFNYYEQTKRIALMKGLDFDFTKSPHMLITGASGSGKSYFLETMLELYNIIGKVILIDPKASIGARLAKKENIEFLVPGFVNDESNGISSMFFQSVNKKMAEVENIIYKRQSQLFNNTDKKDVDFRYLEFEPIFLAIDEVAAIVSTNSKKLRDEFFGYLTRIALLGREAGIYLICSLQSARAEYIPVAVRDQFAVRVLLGRIDRSTSQFLFPNLEQAPYVPLGGNGTGIISIEGNKEMGAIEPIATPTIQ